MAKSETTLQSWQILHFARKHLGRSVLYAIFGKKNARIVDYWCEDPRYTAKGDTAFDPLQGVKNLIDLLDDQGHSGVARSCLAFLSPFADQDQDHLQNVLPTMAEEKLADFQAVAKFQTALDNHDSLDEIAHLKKEAIDEIERTFARHLMDLTR